MRKVIVLEPISLEGVIQAPGDPAFGASLQCGDILRGQLQAHHPIEKRCGFGGGKAQAGPQQFIQLTAGAVTGQGQRRVLLRGNDQVHLRRLVLNQKASPSSTGFESIISKIFDPGQHASCPAWPAQRKPAHLPLYPWIRGQRISRGCWFRAHATPVARAARSLPWILSSPVYLCLSAAAR